MPQSPVMSAFKDHFSGIATGYAAFRPHYPAALFDYVAGLCRARRRAWDCACGSGQATLALAERFDSVVATDASAQQLSAAVPHARVSYRVAPAEQSGIEDASIDLVTVAQALHWLDLQRFYAEVRRVLVPQGVLAVWTYGTLRMADPPIDACLAQFAEQIVGPYWPPERRLVDTGYRDLPFPFIELDAPRLQMEQRWPLPHLAGYLRSWSATVRFIERNGHDPVDELISRLEPLWGAPSQPRVIAWPLSLRVGRSA
jgi:SAM-dependent methyltransferase